MNTDEFRLPRQYDRRVKFLNDERECICTEYRKGIPVAEIAEKHGCCVTTVRNIVDPEQYARHLAANNRQQNLYGLYRPREEQTLYMRELRKRKREIMHGREE